MKQRPLILSRLAAAISAAISDRPELRDEVKTILKESRTDKDGDAAHPTVSRLQKALESRRVPQPVIDEIIAASRSVNVRPKGRPYTDLQVDE